MAAKWFVRHQGKDREKALARRDRRVEGRPTLIVPEFALRELLNAIRYSPRGTEADGAAAVELLESLHLRVERLSGDLLRTANAIAWAYRASVYDAAYVALAELLGFPLVTADEALVRKFRGHSIVLPLHRKGVRYLFPAGPRGRGRLRPDLGGRGRHAGMARLPGDGGDPGRPSLIPRPHSAIRNGIASSLTPPASRLSPNGYWAQPPYTLRCGIWVDHGATPQSPLTPLWQRGGGGISRTVRSLRAVRPNFATCSMIDAAPAS